MPLDRRKFVQNSLMLTAGFAFYGCSSSKKMIADDTFEISLAEFSLHKSLFSNKINNLDFPEITRKRFGLGVAEYVNQFFMDKANNKPYLQDLMNRCKDNGIKNHLIMIDGEGELGNLNKAERAKAVENHYKWVDAAQFLGCATIRVNAYGEGDKNEVMNAAADGLTSLAEYAKKANINIIVENHGGVTSDGKWVADLMTKVGRKDVGTLPDFGNFCIKRSGKNMWEGECLDEYDKYKGTAEMMPFAKGVSAKTFDFDAAGNCVETDYTRMMKIIKDSGFHGYMGVEWEGTSLTEDEGIIKTIALLEKTGKEAGYKVIKG